MEPNSTTFIETLQPKDKTLVTIEYMDVKILILVFMKSEFSEIPLPAKLVFILSSVLLFVNLIFLPWAVAILRASKSVHMNLKDLCIFYIVFGFIGYLSKIFLTLTELDILTDFESWKLSLVIATAFRLNFQYYTCLGFVGVVIERIFSLRYVNNYETESKRWVFYLSAGVTSLTVLALFIPAMLANPPIYYSYSVLSVFFFSTSVGVYKLYNKQKRLEEKMIVSAQTTFNQYSLSGKYQITENRLVFQMIKNYMLCLVILSLPTAIFFFLGVHVYGTKTDVGILLYLSYSLFESFWGISLVSSVYFTIGRHLRAKRMKTVDRKWTTSSETDMHFMMLKKYW